MTRSLIAYAATLVVFAIVDFIWLGFIAKDLYRNGIGHLMADTPNWTAAVLFYLLSYGLSTIGIFAVLTLVRDGDGEASHLSQWAGLASRSPVTAAVMSLFLLSLAGIPLTAGFIGKFAVFRAAIEVGAWPLALVALLASAVAAFYYLRVIVLMYFSPPAVDGPTVGGLPAPRFFLDDIGLIPTDGPGGGRHGGRRS